MATRPGQVLPGFRYRARRALGMLAPPDFRQPLASDKDSDDDRGTSAVWRDWLFELDSGEPPPAVTGTLARTNADDTAAATAVESFTGSLAATNGGGGGSSGPTDFTAEYDPNDVAGTVLTGTNVDELIDLSANTFDFDTDSGATPVTLEAGPGGRDVLRFTGGNNGPHLTMSAAPTGILSAAAFSFIAEIKPAANPSETEASSNPDEGNTVLKITGSDRSVALQVRYNTGTTTIQGGVGGFTGGYGDARVWVDLGAIDEWGVLAGTYDGTTLRVSWNGGTPQTSTITLGTLGTVTGGQIGKGTGVLSTFNGDIGRSRIFDREIDATEIDDTIAEWSGAGGGAGDTLAASGIGNGIGGSLAHTNGADTLAATGTPTVAGTLARTNADDTLAAAGDAAANNDVTGTLARSNGADTLAATAVETFSGSLARTNGNDTSAASGTPAVAGTLARSNGADTLAASGTPAVAGTLARSNGADTLAATAVETFSGSLARTNANDTSAASGTPAVAGTLARANADDTAAASGTPAVSGTLARSNGADTLAAEGTFGDVVNGTLARTNADDTLSATGTALLAVTGTASVTNGADTLAASGATGVNGTLARTNGNDTSAASGTPTVTGETGTRAAHEASFDEFWTGVDWIGEWFTYTDGAGLSVTFEFDDGGGVTPGNTPIVIDSADDALTVAGITRAAIMASALDVTVGEIVYLDLDAFWAFTVTQRLSGTRGNTSVDASSSFLLGADAFSGGTDLGEAADVAAASGSSGNTVTAAASVVNGNDTSAASGTPAVAGTASATNAADTLAAAGTPTVAGALARTNAADTASAAGVFGDSVSGSVARANAADTSAAEALTSYLASGGSVNANDEAAAQALVAIIAAGAAANTNDAASMAGAQTFLAALARANLADTLAAAGLVLEPTTGSSGTTNANDTAAASGAQTAAVVVADTLALPRSWADVATSSDPPVRVLVGRVLPRSWADSATSTEPPTKVLVARAGARVFSDSA